MDVVSCPTHPEPVAQVFRLGEVLRHGEPVLVRMNPDRVADLLRFQRHAVGGREVRPVRTLDVTTAGARVEREWISTSPGARAAKTTTRSTSRTVTTITEKRAGRPVVR